MSSGVLDKLRKYVFHPRLALRRLLGYFLDSPLSRIVSDRAFIKLQYKLTSGKKLNLNDPVYFGQKISWLKLYNRKHEYTKMADKYEVRAYVEEKIGSGYLIPLLGVYRSFDEIDFDSLPNQFVIKCTHDSGSFEICKDKTTFDITRAKKRITKKLKSNYFYHGREWVYKNIKPRIIVQKYMENETDAELKDYKVFCFDGEPKLIQVVYDKFSGYKQNYYSPNWETIHVELRHPSNRVKIGEPNHLSLMLKLAAKLSIGIPFIRVDFFVINETIYFNEFTFYPENGFWEFKATDNIHKWDTTVGSWIRLPARN